MAKAPQVPAVLAVQIFSYLKPDAEAPETRAFITADKPTINLTGLDVTELPDEERVVLAQLYTQYKAALTEHLKAFPNFDKWLEARLPPTELDQLPARKYRSFALNRIMTVPIAAEHATPTAAPTGETK